MVLFSQNYKVFPKSSFGFSLHWSKLIKPNERDIFFLLDVYLKQCHSPHRLHLIRCSRQTCPAILKNVQRRAVVNLNEMSSKLLARTENVWRESKRLCTTCSSLNFHFYFYFSLNGFRYRWTLLTRSLGFCFFSRSSSSISCSSSSICPERRAARAMKYGGNSPIAVPAPCMRTITIVI